MVAGGFRAVMLFVIQIGSANRFALARDIDPAYGTAFDRALAAGVEALGLSLLPPAGERLWTLNAVRVPDGVDEAAVRKQLLETFNIEIGAGLGPLAGKIWRVGLMGASSAPRLIVLLRGALESALVRHGHHVPA
jgi:alanine-glyoxylate transaminase/serine-glyoxylate transaminase/serine-pyruvate transaminase